MGLPDHSNALAALLLTAAVALSCGARGVARQVAPGTSAAAVQELFGEPDERYADPRRWVEILAADKHECEPLGRITHAWRYDRMLGNDAMVFFDSSGAVICVHEGSELFDERSH